MTWRPPASTPMSANPAERIYVKVPSKIFATRRIDLLDVCGFAAVKSLYARILPEDTEGHGDVGS